MRKISINKYDRIIDANFNRAKEGLRVCEDICRFVYNAKTATRQYKALRHRLTEDISCLRISNIIKARNIEGDVGRDSATGELKRNDVADIYYANSQRVKESIRVLEEFSKIKNRKLAVDLKSIRYKVYALEKQVIKKC